MWVPPGPGHEREIYGPVERRLLFDEEEKLLNERLAKLEAAIAVPGLPPGFKTYLEEEQRLRIAEAERVKAARSTTSRDSLPLPASTKLLLFTDHPLSSGVTLFVLVLTSFLARLAC